MKEVKHILRQNGALIEEIIAVRSGRTLRYVKKDNLGKITKGVKFMDQRASTPTTVSSPTPAPVKPKPKIGIAERLNNFLDNDTILD